MAKKGHIPWNKGKKGVQIPWNKGKPWNSETLKKISLALTGKKMSQETKEKISNSLKGPKNHNYGKHLSEKTRDKLGLSKKIRGDWKGEKNPNYGNKNLWSQETRTKLSKSLKGRIFSDLHRQRISLANKGKKISDKTRKKLIESQKGKHSKEKNPMWGKHHTEETIRKISKHHQGKYSLEKNPNWRGGISFEPYNQEWKLHKIQSIIRNRDNNTCQLCKVKNKSLHTHHINYNKKDSDYYNLIALCNSCHSKTSYNRPYWIEFFNNIMFFKTLEIDRIKKHWEV